MCGKRSGNELSEADARRLLAECSDDQIVATLQDVLVRFRPGTWITINQVAALAQMSVRSLQRRLADEGETFARISCQTRAKVAAELLENSDLSLGEIAAELGYTERTNFIRAFKRSSGLTPEKFRAASSRPLNGVK